ncbi:YpoC family protein [Salsuginibacillus kocurii]|uniref:YpoC family protein n=1 Tax=Salsuginibacillus kocurii TaxID=427078 RepID=UPI003084252C
MRIPAKYLHQPFYETSTQYLSPEYEWDEGMKYYPFYADILADNAKIEPPWEMDEYYVPQLISVMRELLEILERYFDNRDRAGARPYMLACISSIYSAVWWMNHLPVPPVEQLTKDCAELDVVPYNFKDRVSFFMQQPDQYHVYTQLDTVVTEIEKLHAVMMLKRKRDNT